MKEIKASNILLIAMWLSFVGLVISNGRTVWAMVEVSIMMMTWIFHEIEQKR